MEKVCRNSSARFECFLDIDKREDRGKETELKGVEGKWALVQFRKECPLYVLGVKWQGLDLDPLALSDEGALD
jgi:hypothetical protein